MEKFFKENANGYTPTTKGDEMSYPKDLIPIAKQAELAAMLHEIANCIEKATKDYEESGIEGPRMDGWITIHKGVTYVWENSRKICGPVSKIHAINIDKLMGDGMAELTGKGKSRKTADEAVDQARLGIAAEPKPKYVAAKKAKRAKKR